MSNVLLRLTRCVGAAALVGVIGMSGTALAGTTFGLRRRKPLRPIKR